ncbi:MAG: hypothetical protein ACT4OI_01675 [Methanobacteriota archaeon]
MESDVEAAATRGRLGPPSDVARAGIRAVAVLALAIALGYVFYSLQFSGSAQWAFGVAVVGVLGVVGTYVVVRSTRSPDPFEARAGRREIHEGELTSLAGTVERAEQGRGFSRDLLVVRVRDALSERIRLVRGLSPEAMRALEADEDALRAVVRDEVLAAFLGATRDREARAAWASASGREAGLLHTLRYLMDRAEGWR